MDQKDLCPMKVEDNFGPTDPTPDPTEKCMRERPMHMEDVEPTSAEEEDSIQHTE